MKGSHEEFLTGLTVEYLCSIFSVLEHVRTGSVKSTCRLWGSSVTFNTLVSKAISETLSAFKIELPVSLPLPPNLIYIHSFSAAFSSSSFSVISSKSVSGPKQASGTNSCIFFSCKVALVWEVWLCELINWTSPAVQKPSRSYSLVLKVFMMSLLFMDIIISRCIHAATITSAIYFVVITPSTVCAHVFLVHSS